MESPRRITPPTRTRHKHAAPPPQLFAKSGPNGLHLIAGVAYRTHFETGFADGELLANLQAVHVQAIGCNVSRGSFPAGGPWPPRSHEISTSKTWRSRPGPRVGAAFEAGVAYSTDFGELLYRQMLLRGAEKILHSRHVL